MSETAYRLLSDDNDFEKPAFPEPLEETAGATQFQILEERKRYENQVKLCHECTLLQRVLVQQIREAIEDEYLAPFVDEATGLITSDINEFMTSLVSTYGDISPIMLNQKREEITTMVYEDHNKPVDIIFTAIEKYSDLADLSGAKESPDQMVNMAKIILTRSGLFTQDIRAWEDGDETSFSDFKKNFKRAQLELRRHSAPVSDLGLHNANAIADHVIQELRTRQLDEEEGLGENATQLQMQLAELQEQIQQLKAQRNMTPTQKRNNTPNQRPNNAGRNTQRARRNRYFWTHGLCAHSGIACRNKADGHIDAETVEDRQGGSTCGCNWVQPE